MKSVGTDKSDFHVRVHIVTRPNGTTQMPSMKNVLGCLYRTEDLTHVT